MKTVVFPNMNNHIEKIITLAIAAAVLSLAPFARAADKSLADYRTVKNAKSVKVLKPAATETGAAGFLGIEVAADSRGRLKVTEVAAGSPAEVAGLERGDIILEVGSEKPRSVAELRDGLQGREAGESIVIKVQRTFKKVSLTAKLTAASHPLKLAGQRGLLGVQVEATDSGDGLRITSVTPDYPAVKAGIKTNDVLLKINDTSLAGTSSLSDLLSTFEAGQKVTVTYRHGKVESHVDCELEAEEGSGNANPFADRPLRKRTGFRIGIVRVEFPDVERNAKVSREEWEEFFFSTNKYSGKVNATGQKVYGSMNDYYRELSCGQFTVTGKVFDWVKMEKKRADYSQGTASARSKSIFFNEALDAVIARDGTNALAELDGIMFIFAGDRLQSANRGTLYWPHQGGTTYKGKRWSYIICPEGAPRMINISLFCHEFGHILGLPDQYARPENPGSEGLGGWCAMSNQSSNGRPQHFCAWCKERMGWLQPTIIDPTVKQKLILSPVENTTNQCFKVLVRADGSEYLLLENRRKQNFDQSLVADGLLIWHVVGGRLMLEESHGVEGPSGPRVFLGSVPYPSTANNSFTPYTTPSSRAQLGGGLPVYLTNIRKLDDGRVAFQIGYQYE